MEVGFVNAYRRARWTWYARWARLVEGSQTLVKAVGAVAMALLTAVAAQVEWHTPLSPVPYTGQVLLVLLSGALLGSRWGAASQTLYVAMGAVGLPVYAGGTGGWARLVGLTGGYLVGFVLAAALVGWLAERRRLEPNRPLLVAAPLGLLVLAALAAVDLALLSRRTSHLALWQIDYSSADALLVLALLAGFFAAAGALAAFALLRGRHMERLETFLAMVTGLLVVYACGALVFWAVGSTAGPYAELAPVTFDKVLEMAIVPFVAADLVKAALAVGAVALLTPRKGERLARGA